MPDNQTANALRTLLVSGYIVSSVNRISQRATILSVHKRDRLGGLAASTILLSEAPSINAVEMLRRIASETHSQPLLVTTRSVKDIPTLKPAKFFDLLGGIVRSDRLIRDDLSSVLNAFGQNRLPKGFIGKPETLLEEFVKDGLEFLLESRGYHYGQDRLFESVPDGVVLGKLNLYFDGKAYRGGYHPSSDDIKRFAGYVTDFNNRYESVLGRIHAFVVVSGSFTEKKNALENKASNFYALCNTQLCCMTASDFGQIVTDVRLQCANRSAINWAGIFSQLRIKPTSIASELRRISKDKALE